MKFSAEITSKVLFWVENTEVFCVFTVIDVKREENTPYIHVATEERLYFKLAHHPKNLFEYKVLCSSPEMVFMLFIDVRFRKIYDKVSFLN